MITLSYEAICEQGPVRPVNQDRILCRCDGSTGLFLVADGMGGHFYGEFASEMIVAGYDELWTDHIAGQADFGETVEAVKAKLDQINQTLVEQNRLIGEICGSTLTLLYIREQRYCLLHIGDSRAYLWQEGELLQLTVDQNWMQQKRAEGLLSEEQINSHPNRDKLTQAVGCLPRVVPSLRTGIWEPPSAFLLCSDGLYRCFDNEELSALISEYSLAQIGEKAAKTSTDNYSAILVKLESQGEES